MQLDILHVVNKAQRQFEGAVMLAAVKEDEDFATFYFVAIKRHHAPDKNRPYMTITARYDKFDIEGEPIGGISFHWGHYDLTLDQVHFAINEHKLPWEDSNA